jgi:hypothetical protein
MPDKPMTAEQMQAEALRLDLELKQTLLAEARENLQNTRENLQDRQNKRDRIVTIQRSRAKQLRDEENMRRARIVACPHKKGGMDLSGYREGTDEQYAVIRHQFPNSDYMIQCQRCANVVLPPVEPLKVDFAEVSAWLDYFKTPALAGFFAKEDQKGFATALKLYRLAAQRYNVWLKMPTLNVASTSGLVSQVTGAVDFKRLYRIAMHEIHHIPLFLEQQWPPDEDKAVAA